MSTLYLTAPFDTPEKRCQLKALRAGDIVKLSGVLLTGRDQAHKRIYASLQNGEQLQFPLEGQCIYYVGPCPAAPGEIIGPCGPTTSYRCDAFAPRLMEAGLAAMIGKGFRSQEVIDSMKAHGAVYFSATGGAASLIARCITKCEVIAYHDLGTEAVHRLEVKDLPLVVAIDTLGNNLYAVGPEKYKS